MTATSLPELYQYEACPFCWKVRAFLDYKGIPYTKVEVHPLNKKELKFSEGYKKVPVFLAADGEQVNDSTNIIRYVEEHYPAKPVFETDEEAKRHEEQWLNWANETLVKALPPLIYQSLGDSVKAFGYISKVGNFNWLQKQLIKYSGAAVMTMVARKSAKRQNITNPGSHMRSCVRQWEKALGGTEFLGGSKPNAADLSVFGYLKAIHELPAFEYVSESKPVLQWFNRVDKRCQPKVAAQAEVCQAAS